MYETRALLPVLLAFLLALLGSPASAEPADEVAPPGPRVKELTEDGVAAITRGLQWLARSQQSDGSWIAEVGYKLNSGYVVTERSAGHVGVTALAGMAFLAGGHTPGRARYGRNVQQAVEFVLSCVNTDGMITQNETRMYSHAFGTLFLAEVYGMTRDAKIKEALDRATEFTWKSQNKLGGWRYAPFAPDSDMSITVCQVMALRAARNIGIRVPKESIDRAVNYVLMSANTIGHRDAGSFKYQYRDRDAIPTRNSFALTAAGLATLYSAGLYSNEDILAHIREHGIEVFQGRFPPPRIEQILRYLRNTYATTPRGHYFYYYGNYYAVQALFIAGGIEWEEYFGRVQRDLVEDQRQDGSWPDRHVGPTYATASACLILQIPYRYLPIFQR
jgi:hypothetical protein